MANGASWQKAVVPEAVLSAASLIFVARGLMRWQAGLT